MGIFVAWEADTMIKGTRSNSGFTLMELMVVVGIISIMTAIAIPLMTTWIPEFRLRGAARDIISCIQEIKMAAITKNKNAVAVFNLSAGSYASFVDNGEGGGIIHDDLRNGTEPYLKNITLPAGVVLASSTFNSNSSGYLVCFNSRGLRSHGSTAGNIILQNSNMKSKKIIVNPAGSIQVE